MIFCSPCSPAFVHWHPKACIRSLVSTFLFIYGQSSFPPIAFHFPVRPTLDFVRSVPLGSALFIYCTTSDRVWLQNKLRFKMGSILLIYSLFFVIYCRHLFALLVASFTSARVCPFILIHTGCLVGWFIHSLDLVYLIERYSLSLVWFHIRRFISLFILMESLRTQKESE